MPSPIYRRPPITEAVLELRFATPLAIDVIEKVRKDLTEAYPAPPAIIQNINIRGIPPQPVVELGGYRLTSGDGSQICIVGTSNFAISRLAPYPGWDPFVAKAREAWKVLKKAAGAIHVQRVGVRFINRIDVSTPNDEPVDLEKLMVFRPLFPQFEGAQGVDNFAINCAMRIHGTNFTAVLNAGTVPSPLVKTASFLLDIDIGREIDVPRNDDALWDVIDQARPIKNRIFEASITDDARKLFSS